MRKKSCITREQIDAINWEFHASPVARDELLVANPYHKGFDHAVQAVRFKTPRSTDLSAGVGRAEKDTVKPRMVQF